MNEITTDRKQAIEKSKQTNGKHINPANKIITETDDKFGTRNINGIHLSNNNKNSMSPFNKIIPNQITEIEISERVKYLQAIVDNSPKLNLEVNKNKIITKIFIITGDKFECASSGS